jgi:hypothetical protein
MAMTPNGATGRIGNFWDDSLLMFSFILENPFTVSMSYPVAETNSFIIAQTVPEILHILPKTQNSSAYDNFHSALRQCYTT